MLVADIFKYIVEIFYIYIIISTIVVVLLDNRSPVKTMAWILVLIFLPVVGFVFYFFFGQNVRRKRLISRRIANQLTRESLARLIKACAVPPAGYQTLVRFFQKVNQALLLPDNSLRVFTEGEDMLQSLLHDLAQAKKHIHLEFYIFEDDPVGRMVRDILIERARAGVKVKVLYDDVGCWNVPDRFFREMQAEGIETYSFLKVKLPFLTGKINFRNHRKIVVIDGKIGYVGGMNLALRYFRPGKLGVWRDTHLRVEGSAVHGLQRAFLIDWYFIDKTFKATEDYFPLPLKTGNIPMQIVTSEPVGLWRDIMFGLTKVIAGAKKYFYVQTPYLMPTPPILQALQTAALSGVDVRLMIPEKSDNRIVQLATRSYLDDILLAGVNVYVYRKGFLHSKLMVCDDELCTVGSTNMDFRSFEHNFEINAFIYDTRTSTQIRKIFLQDQKFCRKLSLRRWRRRPWRKRLEESVVRLLAPLL